MEKSWSDEQIVRESKKHLAALGFDEDASVPAGYQAIAMLKAAQAMRDDLYRRLDAAKAENARLQENYLAIERGEIKPGELTIEGVSPVVGIFAAGCYDMLNHRDAENFVQFDMIPKAGARALRVTVAWANGKLPAERIAELEAENKRLRAQVPDAEMRGTIRAVALAAIAGNISLAGADVLEWLDSLEAQDPTP